jgi:hypothetical protein
VAAYGDDQSEGLNGEAADHEGRSRGWRGKEHECGYGEKESGWHDQQSGVFHGLSLSRLTTPAAKTCPFTPASGDGSPGTPSRWRPRELSSIDGCLPDPESIQGSAIDFVCDREQPVTASLRILKHLVVKIGIAGPGAVKLRMVGQLRLWAILPISLEVSFVSRVDWPVSSPLGAFAVLVAATFLEAPIRPLRFLFERRSIMAYVHAS